MERQQIIFSKTANLIRQYLELFGQVQVEVYRLHGIPQSRFVQFLDSTRIALRRANHRPLYVWMYDAAADCYVLILLTSAFFRTDAREAAARLERLWCLYSSVSVRLTASCIVTSGNEQDALDRISHVIRSSCPDSSARPWYRHSFGVSQDIIRQG